jgi:hypothetical protein
VPKVPFIPGAEIVEAQLAFRSKREPVFGTASVASEAELARPAHSGQLVALVLPEFALLVAADHLADRSLRNVAEAVVRIHEVVT